MATVEVTSPVRILQQMKRWKPTKLQQNKRIHRPVMDLVTRLLYWQGFWLKPPNTNLDVYNKYFKLRLSKLLTHHRYFRLCRPFYALSIMAFLFVHLFVVYPFAIFFFWGNKMEAIENTYAILFCFLGLSGLSTLFFKKKALFVLISKLQQMATCKLFDDEDSKRILRKTDVFCHTVTKYVHLIFVPLMSSGLAIYVYVFLLPKRKLFFRSWFPYDIKKSPAFEVTLFIWTLGCILTFCIVNTILCLYCSTFLYVIVYFKIIVRKFRNIRRSTSTSIRKMNYQKVPRCNSIASRSRLDFALGEIVSVTDSSGNVGGPEVERLTSHTVFNINIPGAVEQNYSQGGAFRVSTLTEHQIPNAKLEYTVLGKRKPECRLPIILRKRIKPRIKAKAKVINIEGDENAINLHLLEVVKNHQEIIRCTNEWFSVMNLQFIVSFLTSMGTLGSTVLLVTAATDFTMKELFLITLFLEAEIVFFIFNLMANEITIEAAAVGEALYTCDWLRASPRFKQSMLIIMSRANLPLEMKPTGLNPLSRQMFGEVSVSAFKMLSKMNKLFN